MNCQCEVLQAVTVGEQAIIRLKHQNKSIRGSKNIRCCQITYSSLFILKKKNKQKSREHQKAQKDKERTTVVGDRRIVSFVQKKNSEYHKM